MKYTVYEAADKLGVKPNAIYMAIARGKIKLNKIADIYLITESQLQKLRRRKNQASK